MDLGTLIVSVVLSAGTALLVSFVVAPRVAERRVRELGVGAIQLLGEASGSRPRAGRRNAPRRER